MKEVIPIVHVAQLGGWLLRVGPVMTFEIKWTVFWGTVTLSVQIVGMGVNVSIERFLFLLIKHLDRV